jgi:hypothetical protein
MIRLSLFQSRQFDAINATTVLFYSALNGAAYLVILELELQLGYSAVQAGAALIPESVVFLLIAPISGRLVARVGPRWADGRWDPVRGRSVHLALSSPSRRWLRARDPARRSPVGSRDRLAVAPLTAAVLAAVSDVDLGEASAINDATSRVGGLIAIAIVPALIGAAGPDLAHALPRGFQPAMIVMAGLCVGGALITALF